MSKTIETIIADMVRARFHAKQARADLAARQVGLESGTQVERKLRLTLINPVGRQAA
jgi:hypothetical protein